MMFSEDNAPVGTNIPPYPVITLAQAHLSNTLRPNLANSLPHLINFRAETYPDEVAVGFPHPQSASSNQPAWEVESYTFRQLRAKTEEVAQRLVPSLHEGDQRESRNVAAILSPSGPEFLFAFLAYNRLGYAVLLIDPKLQDEAICYLLSKTSTKYLLVHPNLLSRAEALSLSPKPLILNILLPDAVALPVFLPDVSNIRADDVALYFHSSGSTSMPKAIPVLHREVSSIQAYPSSSPSPAAYTTTPLYHGGMSDFFRSINAVSPIYFFPLATLPVTAANVKASLQAIPITIKYFFSVPFILEMLWQEADTRVGLKEMDMVSVGGAPLDDNLGNAMVQGGWNLVSRMGSSECGFLLSSHREYETDLEWNWLRAPPTNTSIDECLFFEPQATEAGAPEHAKLYELVVKPGWPQMSLKNRPDGSYATGDLFLKHAIKQDAWKYQGRADDIIVLSNGLKFTASAVAGPFSAHPQIAAVLAFGDDRPFPGILLELHSSIPQENLGIAKLVDEANALLPAFAKLMLEMVVVLPEGEKIPKSSKGTVQRGRALKAAAKIIDRTYELSGGVATQRETTEKIPIETSDDMVTFLKGLVEKFLGRKIAADEETDLFDLGIDSLMALRLRDESQRSLDLKEARLKPNVVYEHNNLQSLASYLFDLSAGINRISNQNEVDYLQMENLVRKYGDLLKQREHEFTQGDRLAKGQSVILTGATGSLGAHLLSQLLSAPVSPNKVYCLVRASGIDNALERVSQALKNRRLPTLTAIQREKLVCLPVNLGEPHLGLPDTEWHQLAEEVDVVIHAAWEVNFNLSLEWFERDCLRGLHNLLDLLLSKHTGTPKRFLFCSSISSVLSYPSNQIPETASLNPSDSNSLGYSRSKWVAEGICRRAAELSGTNLEVAVARIGQLCGDTKLGIWNETEAWPLMLRSGQSTQVLPVFEENPSWLPVDICAASLLEILGSQEFSGVYHVLNRHTEVSWHDIRLMLRRSCEMKFEDAPPETWLAKIRALPDTQKEKTLLGLWEDRFLQDNSSSPVKIPDVTRTEQSTPSLSSVGGIQEKWIQIMVERWRETGFFV